MAEESTITVRGGSIALNVADVEERRATISAPPRSSASSAGPKAGTSA